MKDFDKKTKAYALKNALAHEGKAMQGAVISALFNEGLKKEDMKKYGKKISEIIMQVNALPQKDKEKEFEKLKNIISEREIREGLPELPDVKKSGVIMRFAPSASGPLHIGHALVSCLSFAYVKKYKGKFYVRIEDTNPENIDPEAYKLIEQDAKWLFENKAKIIIQSDRIELYYKYALTLIKKNSAYACTCSGDDFRKFSKQKKDCPCRKLTSKENLIRWNKMLGVEKEKYSEGEVVLRFKTPKEGMKHPNPAMRDFPLARINEAKHPRQKNKYRVWPLMNLAVATDDIEMKMTHIIRGKDHRDNAKRQEMIYKVLGKKYPWNAFIGRYKFKDMELSTTKMREAIEQKKYSGWDDPRLPTIISLKKQKYNPQAFQKFAEHIGLSEVDKIMDKNEYFRLLKSFNENI